MELQAVAGYGRMVTEFKCKQRRIGRTVLLMWTDGKYLCKIPTIAMLVEQEQQKNGWKDIVDPTLG